MGLAYGLIQKKSVDANDIRFVWTWQCILGLSVSGIIFYSAGTLANFFAKPEAEFIFQWLSLVILINACDCALDSIYLKNHLITRYCKSPNCPAISLGLVVSGFLWLLPDMAEHHWWLLGLVQSASNLIILYFQVRHPLTFRFWTLMAATCFGMVQLFWEPISSIGY